jgi:hypothetical protein
LVSWFVNYLPILQVRYTLWCLCSQSLMMYLVDLLMNQCFWIMYRLTHPLRNVIAAGSFLNTSWY